MAPVLRNVAIVGASGRLGPFILKAVQADPAFNVTVITRHNSKATFPEGTKIIRVTDGYPDEEMVEVFKGQDAVVLSLGFQAQPRHSALVQASIKAGVKRLVASGFGANDNNAALQKVFPFSAQKAKQVEELKGLEKPGWSWTSICCGLFFDFCITSGFFGFNATDHTGKIWDSGNIKFSTTTRTTIGLAVAKVLSHPAETENKTVFISSFECSMNDLLAGAKKATGVDDWTITHVSTDEQIRTGTEEWTNTHSMMGMAKLAMASNLKEEFEANFAKQGLLMNETLGLPVENVDEVVARVLKEGQ